MTNNVILAGSGLILSLLCMWAFRALPREQWQFLAVFPTAKTSDGDWHGVNLTYYGALTACAVTCAVGVYAVLMSTIGLPGALSTQLGLLVLGIAVPASKVVAYLVEGKRHTFSIGGASFVGIMSTPWVIMMVNAMHDNMLPSIPIQPTLAALWVAFGFGEGMGRLACLSFGCCYGLPLSQASSIVQRMFQRWHLQFTGATKKATYESGLETVPLIPIQALTAVVNIGAALIGMKLFLASHFAAAIALLTIVTQGWRIASEYWRADYRGRDGISGYQIMALMAMVYSLGLCFAWPPVPLRTLNLMDGLVAVWRPECILGFQALWLIMFVLFGRSQVTGSNLRFRVRHDHI